MLKIIIFLAGLSIISVFEAKASETFHNITGVEFPFSFTIATHEKNDEKIEHEVILFQVQCIPDKCSLKRFTLNNCGKNQEEQLSSKPSGSDISTDSDFLTAKLANGILKMTLYQATHHNVPATIIAEFDNHSLTKLKSFEATGFIDTNQDLKTFYANLDKRIEYSPVKGNILKKLDCPFFLPGIKQ
jgi:hypothetical protein